MKKAMLIALAIVAVGCSTRVQPGYVGIKITTTGTDKGVNDLPLQTGRVWYNPMTEYVLEYPTFVQNVTWTHNVNEGNPINEEITFSNADQMQIAADVSLAYQLAPTKVPTFYVKFRSDKMQTFTDTFMRNVAREQFDAIGGKYHIEQIMGDNANFLKEVRVGLQQELAPLGITLVQFGLVGIPRPPMAVIEAINAKVHATQLAQQKQNELVQVQADMAKEKMKQETRSANVLLAATSEAEANRKLAQSLTPELVEYTKIQRWNGQLPQVTSGGVPLINFGGK